MDIPVKDQEAGFVECQLLVCELQLLRGWSCGVRDEIGYLPYGRSPGKNSWHLLALLLGSRALE